MKKLESLKNQKFAISEKEQTRIVGGLAGPTSTWQDYQTCNQSTGTESTDKKLVDLCFPM